MEDIKKSLISYVIAFSVGLYVLTYVAKFPHYITKNEGIVNEYYLENYTKNVPLDFLFVFLYFAASTFVMKTLNIKKTKNKLLTVGLTTGILTTGFCYYFKSNPSPGNFFSKWFNTVGYSSVIYDVVLLVFMYAIYDSLQNKTKSTE